MISDDDTLDSSDSSNSSDSSDSFKPAHSDNNNKKASNINARIDDLC